jgi:anti-sigma B factor antagonist
MFARADNSFEIRLRNAEGIPILQVAGTMTKTALKAVGATLERLASAGHYNIILNIERVQTANLRFLGALAGTVRKIRAHYGAVDLVAAQDRLQQLLRIGQVTRLFRLSRSESEAILRIKKLQRQPGARADVNAHLVENS